MTSPGFGTHNGVPFGLVFSVSAGSTIYVVLFPPRAIAVDPSLPSLRRQTTAYETVWSITTYTIYPVVVAEVTEGFDWL